MDRKNIFRFKPTTTTTTLCPMTTTKALPITKSTTNSKQTYITADDAQINQPKPSVQICHYQTPRHSIPVGVATANPHFKKIYIYIYNLFMFLI
jgi:hypothetical protein